MAAEQMITIMTEEDGMRYLDLRTIALADVPEIINGEDGYHIVYVSMLSEQIARQLASVSDWYNLTEEQIYTIAVASSLHDIGKTQIPQSILEKAGALTPLEYDIVKKHSVMGEKMTEEAQDRTGISILKKTACDIIRYHHERYDGSGYPDGLAGDRIPIVAQIVSIADTFDALTRERSYKQALSQEVALEMIANGMCGIFDQTLVECLMKVVEDKTLMDIRRKLLSTRSVYEEDQTFIPKKVLLLGNTKYLSDQFLDKTFPDASISVIGQCDLTQRSRLKIYPQSRPNYKEVLDTYDFDILIYFAAELTYDSQDPSDGENLRQFLKATKYLPEQTKCIYLSSLDAAFEERNDRGIMASAKENLCFHYAQINGHDIKVIRIPYLYNAGNEGDWLFKLFDEIHDSDVIRVQERAQSQTYFLSMTDLSELLMRIVDGWSSGIGILTVNDEFGITFEELCGEAAKLRKNTKVEFLGKNKSKRLNSTNATIRKQFSWFSKISILADLEDEYAKYLAVMEKRKAVWWERLKEYMGSHFHLVRILELILMFLLSEALVSFTDSALYFSTVDFRMLYVVLLGTMHGLPYGLAAAFLSSSAWIYARIMSGTNWLTLFYEPTNWPTYIFFFLAGAVCGYIKLVNDNKIRFLREENDILTDKLTFTREIYEDTLLEKRDLKKQIIGSKDSFGKIFDITRQLNSVDSRELYLKIISNFEEVLENRSFSVFSVNAGSNFARLEVASRDIMHNVSRSISLDTYAPVVAKIKKGEVWRNTELLPGMPMFACGVFRNDELLMLIFLWQAQPHQHSLYYVNLFRILCDLAEMSLLRALDYSNAVREKQYIPDTRIQNAEAFYTNLHSFRNLAEKKVFQFQVLQLDTEGKDIRQWSELLQSCVRVNDIIGLMPDGKLRILLSQAGKEDLKFVLPRFHTRGLSPVVLDPNDNYILPEKPFGNEAK